MDLGDAAITPHKVLNNVHLDAGQGSPIHIKVHSSRDPRTPGPDQTARFWSVYSTKYFLIATSFLAFEYKKQRR